MMTRTGLAKGQMEAYIERFASTRICVLGDVMLDRYFWGEVDRISPEAPVPIVNVSRRSARLGGAANVAANLKSLGVTVALAGVVGDDSAGREVKELLTERKIDNDLVAVEEGRETTEKVRIIARNQQVVRADFEVGSPVAVEKDEHIFNGVSGGTDSFDALIISDYGKGVVREESIRTIIQRWRSKGKPVLVDPHVQHFKWYEGSSIITPNTKEAGSFFGSLIDHEDLFTTQGFGMMKELSLEALLITRGEDGMSLFLEDGKQIHIPTVAKEVYDVTGAGDTVISILGAALASGAPLLDAVIMANQGAGEVVKEVGTSSITADRLISYYS